MSNDDGFSEAELEAMQRDSLRKHFTAAALTGLLSGVDTISLMESGRKLPGKWLGEAAVILADHTIAALNSNAPSTQLSSFRPSTASEPGPDTQKSVSPAPVTSGVAAPKGADAPAMPPASSTASESNKTPAGKGEDPQSWKRKPAPLSNG